jgi:putative hemolysin
MALTHRAWNLTLLNNVYCVELHKKTSTALCQGGKLMDRQDRLVLLTSLVVMLMVLVACQQAVSGDGSGPISEEGEGIEEPVVGMPNPAAVYCEGLGYTMEPRENAAGMDAACIFPDGSECGQWDFFAGRCGQEFTYCRQQGGDLLDEGANIGTCVFEDGSTCDEYMLYRGECQPGDNPIEGGQRDAGSEQGGVSAGESGLVVVGWMGYVVSTPEGAQFDDYVIILPEGEVGEFGIEGVSEEVEAQIVELRDHTQPGKFAHFWGALTCDVPDYGGCQVLVERLRVEGSGEFFDPDEVAGWEGHILELFYDEPGAPQPDDAFIPVGDYPVQYGIDSAVSVESGERDLNEVIFTLRESGEMLRIWGEVMCGVPDAGGCRIEVDKIESGGEVHEITPRP